MDRNSPFFGKVPTVKIAEVKVAEGFKLKMWGFKGNNGFGSFRRWEGSTWQELVSETNLLKVEEDLVGLDGLEGLRRFRRNDAIVYGLAVGQGRVTSK